MNKYTPLGDHLAALPPAQMEVEIPIERIDQWVGGLPPTARSTRQWWANNSHVQALEWRRAGWHVERPYFDRGVVRFGRGGRGGSRADGRLEARISRLDGAPPDAEAPATAPAAAADVGAAPVDPHVDRVAALLGDATNARACGEFPWGRGDLATAGLYSWFADADGSAELSAGLGHPVSAGLIYAGQTGADSSVARVPRAATLEQRIRRQHLRGRISASTFRRTLSAILVDRIPLSLAAPNLLTAASTAALTAWMHRHLTLVCVPVTDRASLAAMETDVLRRLDPPLNLMGMRPTPLRVALKQRRARLGQQPGAPEA